MGNFFIVENWTKSVTWILYVYTPHKVDLWTLDGNRSLENMKRNAWKLSCLLYCYSGIVFIRSCPVVYVLYIDLTSLLDLMGESQQALTKACHLTPLIYHLLSKRYTVCILVIWIFQEAKIVTPWLTLTQIKQAHANETNLLANWTDLISLINWSQIVSFLVNKQSSQQDIHVLLKVLAIYFFSRRFVNLWQMEVYLYRSNAFGFYTKATA